MPNRKQKPVPTIKTVSEQTILVVKGVATSQTLITTIRAKFDELYSKIGKLPHGQNVIGYNLARDESLPSGSFPIEVGVLVDEGTTMPDGLQLSKLPAGKVVSITHVGDYSRMSETYDIAKEYIAREGIKLAGPSWEIYGHWSDDPNQLKTEIFHLIQDKAIAG